MCACARGLVILASIHDVSRSHGHAGADNSVEHQGDQWALSV